MDQSNDGTAKQFSDFWLNKFALYMVKHVIFVSAVK